MVQSSSCNLINSLSNACSTTGGHGAGAPFRRRDRFGRDPLQYVGSRRALQPLQTLLPPPFAAELAASVPCLIQRPVGHSRAVRPTWRRWQRARARAPRHAR